MIKKYLKIKNIPGHIAEIGVADGRNAILFGRLIKIHNDQSVRQYIGFDTFDGFTQKGFVIKVMPITGKFHGC